MARLARPAVDETRLTRRETFELLQRRSDRRWGTVQRLGSLLITHGLRWGTLGYIGKEAAAAAQAFAGKSTLAGFFGTIGIGTSIGVSISWAVTVALLALIFFQRRLHKGARERLEFQLKDLQLQLDRRRSSSANVPTPGGDE